MQVTLGEKWDKVFDIIICEAKKPLFVWGKGSFYLYDTDRQRESSTKIKTGNDLNYYKSSRGKTFTNGSAETLIAYLKQKVDK